METFTWLECEGILSLPTWLKSECIVFKYTQRDINSNLLTLLKVLLLTYQLTKQYQFYQGQDISQKPLRNKQTTTIIIQPAVSILNWQKVSK